MPPSSSLGMINEDNVLVDQRFAIHNSGLAQSPPSGYRHGQIVAQDQSLNSHFISSSKPESSTDTSTGTSSRQPQFIFQSPSRDTGGTMSTPREGVGITQSRSPPPLPRRSPSPAPLPDISRLAQRRYARAVQYANFRNAHDTTVPSSHSVSSSVTSSGHGSPQRSASPAPKTLNNTNTIISTTRPLKPPSHSASPRVPPPRIKTIPSVPVTPPRTPPTRTMASSAASITSTSNTTIASTGNGNYNNTNGFAQSSADALEWRKHGKRVRAMLLLEDEEKGGSTFQLTNTCSIERYYRVAERVLEKFLSTSIRNNVNELELAESYLVGNRLVKFLSIVLPTHEQYFSTDPALQVFRKRSQEQLVQLLRYLEEIALVMDELQYNNYILRDLTPEEQTLVKGLTTAGDGDGGGGRTFKGQSATLDVSRDSTRSPMSVQSTRGSTAPTRPMTPTTPLPTISNTTCPEEMMDRTRSPATKEFIPSTAPKPDSLQARVAQVIQMTEAFSDTYESTMEGKPEAAPHLFLKRSLMAAAAATASDDPPTFINSRPSFTPHPHPSMHTTNSIATNIQQQQRTTSPAFSESSDPSLQTLSSADSEANHPNYFRGQQQHHGPLDSGWHEQGGEFMLGWDGNAFASDHQVNSWNRDVTSNKRSIPKLKRPKSRPTRSERARAVAAMQYDQLFTQSQPTLMYSNGTKERNDAAYSRNQSTQNTTTSGMSIPPPLDADAKESPLIIKTKIEDRLERASVVQREIRQHELRKRHTTNGPRWRTPKSEDRTPLKAMPLQDYGDGDDNSLLQDRPQELMSNQGILRHFRGCVQCMLD